MKKVLLSSCLGKLERIRKISNKERPSASKIKFSRYRYASPFYPCADKPEGHFK